MTQRRRLGRAIRPKARRPPSSRGIEFVFNPNRINVATSHAQCRVELVCSPTLLDADCKTVEQMRLVNALCRFIELAREA